MEMKEKLGGQTPEKEEQASCQSGNISMTATLVCYDEEIL